MMIGTPNTGSSIEDEYCKVDFCRPAASDLLTTSSIAKSTYTEKHNSYTHYYPIAGKWTHYSGLKDFHCNATTVAILILQKGSTIICDPNDGTAPLNGAQIPTLYTPLKVIPKCHINKKDRESYEIVRPILYHLA